MADLTELTEEQVKGYILVGVVWAALRRMTTAEREQFWLLLGESFCRNCHRELREGERCHCRLEMSEATPREATMSGYVLQRDEDGKYVTQPGREKSYTDRLEEARIFPTKEAAEGERCVINERLVPLAELLGR